MALLGGVILHKWGMLVWLSDTGAEEKDIRLTNGLGGRLPCKTNTAVLLNKNQKNITEFNILYTAKTNQDK